jgi:hypothetical protein
MDSFAGKIRIARQQSSLLLRQVAAELDIDQAIISSLKEAQAGKKNLF